ncbi:MAG TPA: nucleoside-diphosphate sugar epimerase/dehydratase [Steroidobacter sp.]
MTLRRGSFAQALDVPALLYALATVISLCTFIVLGMYRTVLRFMSRGALFKAAFGALASAALFGFIDYAIDAPLTGNAIAIFALLQLLYLLASRSIAREFLSYRTGSRERVAIYGAGATGAQLARSLKDGAQYLPVAFVDSDTRLQGSVVAGIKVYPPSELEDLIRSKGISSVLLAMPSSSRRQRQAILKSLEDLPVHVRTVPDISDIVGGYATVTELREVDANDLLGREPVAPNEALLGACSRGKVVMVSGAGGSIGSELCRQIIHLGPTTLVLVEVSEAALYQIERELRAMLLSCSEKPELVPLIGDVRSKQRLKEIMQTYGVQTVYHAAAYKHVPIVEHNIMEGIYNNVFGSWFAAEAALECGVETFVLISTDKAVKPTNVMGATKRMAELTLQALQERSTTTRFCMVRFGNVLESSGSVVPLFREQIKRGGPVTVTHKDIIRYFMTIPEASQLVLQAGAMAQGGDVFVLDMGEPVRIVDLARRMIRLMGATVRDASNPDGDIEIQFTGLRPAEKLYEELLIGSNVTGTHHPMIMRANEPALPWQQLREILIALREALQASDCQTARELLMRTVAEYRPECEIQDLVWRRGHAAAADHSNVTTLRTSRARASRLETATLQ